MALPLNLSGRAEKEAYLEVVTATPHVPVFTYEVLDLNERIRGTFPAPADGQITVDADADVTHSWAGTILDPDHRLRIDADAPTQGSLYADRLVRITHSVHVPKLDRVVSVVPYIGRMIKIRRSGAEVYVDSLGLAELGMRGCRPLTIPEGTRTVAAIRELLYKRMGQRRFRFPHGIKHRLARDVSVGWDDDAWTWPKCLQLAETIGHQLFIAGDGAAVLRRPPRHASHTFRWPGDITTEPEPTFDSSGPNRVIVRGKGKVHAFADLPDSHGLSAEQLQRHGVPIWSVDIVEDDKIEHDRQAEDVADRRLKKLSRQEVDAEFDAVPTYHHDPGDVTGLETPDYALEFNLRKFTLPTGASGDMTVGYHKPVRRPRRRTRRRRAASRS